jgi:hypothetical protein
VVRTRDAKLASAPTANGAAVKMEMRRYIGARYYKSAALAPTAIRQNFENSRYDRQTKGLLPMAPTQRQIFQLANFDVLKQ